MIKMSPAFAHLADEFERILLYVDKPNTAHIKELEKHTANSEFMFDVAPLSQAVNAIKGSQQAPLLVACDSEEHAIALTDKY